MGSSEYPCRFVEWQRNPGDSVCFGGVGLARGCFSPFDRACLTIVLRGAASFNHLPAALLGSDPKREGGRRVLFFSGNDAEAKLRVGALIDRLGFFGIDLGPLSIGARLAQPGGPLPALNLVKFD